LLGAFVQLFNEIAGVYGVERVEKKYVTCGGGQMLVGGLRIFAFPYYRDTGAFFEQSYKGLAEQPVLYNQVNTNRKLRAFANVPLLLQRVAASEPASSGCRTPSKVYYCMH
jgi:hypothetical protein